MVGRFLKQQRPTQAKNLRELLLCVKGNNYIINNI